MVSIKTKEDLFAFAEAVNTGANTYEGYTVQLANNIDLNNEAWTPIGVERAAKSFRGTFDGQGYTIENMVVNDTEGTGAGFFGKHWKGDIKNIKFNNAQVTGIDYAGVVIGFADGAQNGGADTRYTVSGCEVTNSTITIKVTNNDGGAKAGAIVGYAYAIDVDKCKVSETTIQGYRDLGGIVGILNTTTTKTASVTNCEIGDNVKIVVDNSNNYKEYEIQSQYNVADYAGRIDEDDVPYATVYGNTGTVTIEWGEIPESEKVYVAQVGDDKFETIEEAIAAAEGSTIELLADATVSAACQINKNGYNLTVGDGFLALKNYNNANGYYDVVAVTKNTTLRMRGSWDTDYAYDKGYEGYNLTDKLLVFPSISLKKGQAFKIADSNWTVQYGGNTIPVLDVNKQLPITNSNGADFVVTSDATCDVYLDTTNNVIYLSNTEIQYTSAGKTSKIYLKPNSNWTQSNAWFAAYFFNNSTNKNTWVKMTKQSDGSYACDVPEGTWENVIFCRMNPSNTTLGWGARWNQSGDLYRNNVKGNCCAINSGQWDCGQNVTWSTK